jgi:heme-degrading monooxygenase HmoA
MITAEVAVAVYTVGLWRVKTGEEDAFVSAWRELATRTASDFPGASAVLLQDRDTPGLFVSSGPWESLEQIESWRSSTTFTAGVEAIGSHLVSFEPHTMNPVVTIGG